MYFAENESPDLAHIRSEILRYRTTSLMNDRERAEFLGLPRGCRIRENAKILSPEKLICGENVWIGEGAILDAQGGLEIGDNCQIGLGVMIWSHTTHHQALAGETGQDKRHISYRATKVGRNTFIGGPSVIGPGVTIGEGVIVSPLSFVEADLKDGAVFSNRLTHSSLVDRIADLEATVMALVEQASRS